MSERERDRVLGPSEEYGGCSRETRDQRRDGGEQPGDGSIVGMSEAWKLELTRYDGLFGSRYLSQLPGVAAGCDDDPNEVYLKCVLREAREEGRRKDDDKPPVVEEA
jgi:hypothetical protein